MTTNTISTRSKFSPCQKTSHFFLLITALNVLAVTLIIVLAEKIYNRCDFHPSGQCANNPFEFASVVIMRISALLNANVIIITLYAGLISFFQERRVTSLIKVAVILFFITFIAKFI